MSIFDRDPIRREKKRIKKQIDKNKRKNGVDPELLDQIVITETPPPILLNI